MATSARLETDLRSLEEGGAGELLGLLRQAVTVNTRCASLLPLGGACLPVPPCLRRGVPPLSAPRPAPAAGCCATCCPSAAGAPPTWSV